MYSNFARSDVMPASLHDEDIRLRSQIPRLAPGLSLPALVSRTARVPAAATALNRQTQQTRRALAHGLVRLILTFSSAGHDAITSASRVKREALVGARSSPFPDQGIVRG